MKLYYSGNHSKLEAIVNRANEIIESPFYISELRKYLIENNRGCYFGIFKKLLENDKQIKVKLHFNPFTRIKINSKSNSIMVSPTSLSGTHRDVIVLLSEYIYRIILSNPQISRCLNFSQEEKNEFLKEMGGISKHYF
ncbi:hypothetical protein [Zunongwangia sp. HRR-M8]|uniref:hypothetical protein n=1 Tax=Zunongwangia sp. HRR-M8 TaxID=3015170 RepID=UPI0022DE32AD|nr:hypothetical protein [Zunongwangia sp. HRR-M8]WBL21680.1 hypothetical protein PBT89_13165 [Zunongwangia sp. HRR-M8]